jgi:hypothetical protein
MESTVQLDRKLITLTFRELKVSREGFIITPPPMPLMAPKVEAMKLISKNCTSKSYTPPGGIAFYEALVRASKLLSHLRGTSTRNTPLRG